MANKTNIASFTIEHLQYVDKNHQLTQPLPNTVDDDLLLALYKDMLFLHLFDRRIINLQRTGNMGTFPSSQGQEGVMIGVGHATHKDDVYCPYYRDHGVAIARGAHLLNLIEKWGGDERGCHYIENKEDFTFCVPIGSQCLHAAGVAFAMKYRQESRAAITMIGEGGTSEGDFYEAMNAAGTWQLPLVIVINNNQWAISVPIEQQTHSQTMAQKAIAAGIDCLQVDGNDVIAVYEATREAINKARQQQGPTVIEAITYRLCDHTTADDASRYVPSNALQEAKQNEPISRLGYYLESQKQWSPHQDKKLREQITEKIDHAVEQYLNTPKAPATDIVDYLYDTLPEAYYEQREEIEQIGDSNP